jgi:hypothetical protein
LVQPATVQFFKKEFEVISEVGFWPGRREDEKRIRINLFPYPFPASEISSSNFKIWRHYIIVSPKRS